MIAEIAAAMASLQAATGIAKVIKEADLSLGKAEMKFKLAELTESLADARIQISEISGLMVEKNRTIKELQEQLNLESTLVYDDEIYWKTDGSENGVIVDGPYCTKCKDSDGKLIRLTKRARFWYCLTCRSTYDSHRRELPR